MRIHRRAIVQVRDMSKTENKIKVMKTELLSPAGSLAAMEAALKAGADAIYIGGTKFGARAYADNPSEEQLVDAIDRVHILDRKLYMTVNTLLKDREIQKELYSYMRPFYEHGLDGVIVQDLGVASFLHREFPALELHASTQMAVTGAESALFLKELGFSRVVPAREISLPEIENIYRQTGLEIESFVHGAMCYSVSGMCLMSSLIGGRSGNRGRCAGVCRLPFTVKDHGKALNDRDSAYPLNMKDMCALTLLPDMIRSGVISFKIEGRMKRPEYTAGITRIYRKYIDRFLADPMHYHVEKEDLQELAILFNRDGFAPGYYQQRNGRQMIALQNAKLSAGKGDGRTKEAKLLYDEIARELQNTALQRAVAGDLFLSEEGTAVLNLSDRRSDEELFVSHYKDIVQKAQKQPMTEERIRTQMNKTGGSEFSWKELTIQMPAEEIFVPVKAMNELRRESFTMLRQEILQKYQQSCQYEAGKENIFAEKALPVAGEEFTEEKSRELFILAEERVLLEKLLRKKLPGISGYYVPIQFLASPLTNRGKAAEDTLETALLEEIISQGKKLRLVLPYLLRMEHVAYCESLLKALRADFADMIDGVLVRNLDSVGLLHRLGMEDWIILDASVYTMNSEARSFWRGQAVLRDTLSHELNFRELQHMDNRCSEMVVYGRTPMMIAAQCVQKTMRGCDRSYALLSLTDRKGAQFPVVCQCGFCYNIIYNSLPLNLLEEAEDIRKLGVASLRLTFTTENIKTAEEIIRRCLQQFGPEEGRLHENKDVSFKGKTSADSYTKEHFRRGVE